MELLLEFSDTASKMEFAVKYKSVIQSVSDLGDEILSGCCCTVVEETASILKIDVAAAADWTNLW